ncbi:FAD-dependent oxidoreductase [Lactobacillus sp. HT06-2]|uniref:FAD-dependent oxidoreductase n=1 Tax=Lactobacillus sp. HT06-2 TaxID=2080222 RepID=UPI000CD937A0|nr:FAD-dependent oxidoreductase [Lactobacillus sp. HT06-2]
MALKDGNYEVIAKVYNGEELPLIVKVENGKLTAIQSKEKLADTNLNKAVIDTLSHEISRTQSLGVDAVSGASYSSAGIISAVKDVVVKAGGEITDSEIQTSGTPKYDAAERTNTEDYSNWKEVPEKIIDEIDTDLVIVGSGIAGLAAAVQAGELGLKTTVLEKNSFVAGNAGGVEGIFGINTKMQKAAGITTEPEKIIAKEMELAQYRVDGSFWTDLVYNSSKNIDWLVKNGVQLTKVNDYSGICQFPTFHWFKDGVAASGYVPYMKKQADKYGVKFMLDTPAYSIIYDGKRVKGVYAKSKDCFIKVNAKATIFATGGVGHNAKLIAKQGWKTKNIKFLSMPSNTGDGYQMARAVGAKDMLLESPEFMDNYIQALPTNRLTKMAPETMIAGGGPEIWVNQNGRRIANENISSYNMLYQHMPIKSTQVTYTIFNKEIWDQCAKVALLKEPDPDEILENAVKKNRGNSLYKADTIEGLAKAVNIPADTLVETVQRYNEFCHNSRDEEFNKEKQCLVPIEKGPFYIGRLDNSNLVGLGGIGENNNFEVIDEDFNTIPGLYAAGADSTMQYRDVYTITLGGSACAHSVNSGRHAAMNAKKYMEKL